MTSEKPTSPKVLASRKNRIYIIVAALAALFLSALDALIMSAAMPTVVADLGGFDLYSWVFSAYLLSRAVSLPVFGKLCDLFKSKTLFNIAIGIFLAGSVLAGISQTMTQLIFSRVFQGIGAGGSFALVYIVLADISLPENRGRMMSLASFIWGLASVLGPTLGGLIVNYFSWRWVFFINLPVGSLSLLGVSVYLIETREKRTEPAIDYWGVLTLSTTVLGLLFAFLLAGRRYDWLSAQIIGLFLLSAVSGVVFYFVEKRAEEPILSIGFFNVPGFSIGNGTAFFSSFAIFSISAFSPLFIQGALNKTPAELGLAMVPLSLGWSLGALFCGHLVNRVGQRNCALLGSVKLMAGNGVALTFSSSTSLAFCSFSLALAGLGMGFVSISTLLLVQDSLDEADLGVATSSHQFSRTLGGTIGIGISGSLVTAMLGSAVNRLMNSGLSAKLSPAFFDQVKKNIENLFQPELKLLVGPEVQGALQAVVGQGVIVVFWAAFLASIVSLVLSYLLPKRKNFQAVPRKGR